MDPKFLQSRMSWLAGLFLLFVVMQAEPAYVNKMQQINEVRIYLLMAALEIPIKLGVEKYNYVDDRDQNTSS